MSSQKSSSRLLEGKRHLLSSELDSEFSSDDRGVVESSTMDCLQCQMVERKNNSSECKIEELSALPPSEGCSVHTTSINGLNHLRNGIDSKPPPALKFSVNAILARAAQAGSSNTGHSIADNDSLSEDTDHLGSEGTGASSDHDNIPSNLSKIPPDNFKQQDVNHSSSPCPTISTSMNNSAIASVAMSSHPYILGPSLTSVMSGTGSLAKPVPRPLGTSPLFSGGSSPLQNLLYRHPYLNTAGMNNNINRGNILTNLLDSRFITV